jgi:hypothetical protein
MATTFPFPASPTVGDQITLADGVTKLVWTGYSWEPVSTVLAGLPSQGPVSGFRNRIINPSGAVQARSINSGVNNGYICDRWVLGVSAGTLAGKLVAGGDSLSTELDASPYPRDNLYLYHNGAAVASPAAGDVSYIAQRIAVEQVADFKLGTAYCKPMVLSFVARTKPGSGSFVIGVSLRSANGDRSFVQNVAINETAQKYSVAIPPVASGTFTNAGGVALYVDFAGTAGTTYQSLSPGVWANGNYLGAAGIGNIGANQSYFRIREVQLEEGTVPTAFEVRPYGTELHLCERYFQKGYTIAPAYGPVGMSIGTWVPLRPTMRITPTIVATSDSQINCSASSSIFNQVSNGFYLLRTLTTAAYGQFNDNWTADAEIS